MWMCSFISQAAYIINKYQDSHLSSDKSFIDKVGDL